MPRRYPGDLSGARRAGQTPVSQDRLSSRTHGPLMEVAMAKSQELSVQQKKELSAKEEKTVPARYFVPNTDIYETDEALTLVMEMPGVEKKMWSCSWRTTSYA